jgi:hypothetical protein
LIELSTLRSIVNFKIKIIIIYEKFILGGYKNEKDINNYI